MVIRRVEERPLGSMQARLAGTNMTCCFAFKSFDEPSIESESEWFGLSGVGVGILELSDAHLDAIAMHSTNLHCNSGDFVKTIITIFV